MNTTWKFATVYLVLFLMVFTNGCTSGQITSSISLVVDSAEVALPVIASQTSVDPAIITAAENYLQAVNTAVTEADPILADATMPASVKAAKITALFAGLASANLPPGTPQAITQVVQKVATSVATFLSNFATNGKPKVVGPNVKITIPESDHSKYTKAIMKARANLTKLQAAKANASH